MSMVKRIVIAVSVFIFIGLYMLDAADGEGPTVVGIGKKEADKYNVEFMQYSRMQPVYRENGIQASLFEFSALTNLADYTGKKNWKEEDIYKLFKQYHVVHYITTEEGISVVTPELEEHAKIASSALARYVSEGGGLYVQPLAVRYPNTQDEKYANLILAPFGAQILHESTFDKTRSFTGKTYRDAIFWFTSNIKPHPVTEGVRGLCLPLDAQDFPAVPAMQYSQDWQIVVGGMKEAQSYKTGADNLPKTDMVGTYGEYPPVVAVREFGKGRIVCYPLYPIFTWLNHRNPLWPDITECNGDKAKGLPSDSMKLQMNSYKWLGEPAKKVADMGTYKPAPYKLVEFEKNIDLDKLQFGKQFGGDPNFAYPDGQKPMTFAPSERVRGIFGARTKYAGGKGTVEEYVKAAKAAGLGFIVFNDPLEKLTPETLDKLKADCAAASKDGSFYACPGLEFKDLHGTVYAVWGEKILFPEKDFSDQKNKYFQWDGQKINYYGEYIMQMAYPGCGVLNYKELRANGLHPENQWWYYHYFPYVYDKDKLVADNYGDYLFGLHDLRWAALASYTRISDPADLAAAAKTFWTSFPGMAAVKGGLNTQFNTYNAAWWPAYHVSQGPEIVSWEAINQQMEYNWMQTRGAQRVRLKFTVKSDSGIAEVKVHDADFGLARRFDGKGEKELSREFEMVHDRQHYLTLEVTDGAGKKAFSQYIAVFSYKQGFLRCGDNLNILGSAGLTWHPDRDEMMTQAKNFGNAEEYAITGWDTWAPICPAPQCWYQDHINIKGKGIYPDTGSTRATVGKIMEVLLGSYNIQIASMRMDHLSQANNHSEKPYPALCSMPKDLGELEYFERKHTIYSACDRMDFYTTWNQRRGKEGRRDYQGSIIWHEGEIRIKKDIVLQGEIPVPLVQMRCPVDLQSNCGNVFVVTDKDEGTRVTLLRDMKTDVNSSGALKPGGYISQMPTVVGYQALLVPHDSNLLYRNQMQSGTIVGFGRDGQELKAGTILKYRYGMGVFADPVAGNQLLEHTVTAFNLGGGSKGYPVEIKTGELVDAVFFFTARAKDNEAVFKLGPQKLIIDLPIRVQGLDDNGCAAVYSTRRPWFRFVPVIKDPPSSEFRSAGTAYFQEPIEEANEMWVGNVFLADNKDLKMTLVVDGQADGAKPFLEINNPTEKEISSTVRSPSGTPLFGGLAVPVKIPAGDSIRVKLNPNKETK